MNVVILDGDLSYPPTSGKRLRTLNLMLPLASRHNLTYLARGSGKRDEERQAVEHLRTRGIRTIVVDDPIARKKGLAFYARLAGNLASPRPYSVTSHFSEKMRAAAQQVAAETSVDLWQVEWSGYLYAVEKTAAPIVLQAHNVDSLIWQRFYETEQHPLKRWYIRQQWRKFTRFEKSAFEAVRRIVAVSPDDAALAKDLFGVERIDVVDNGVDVEYFSGVRPTTESRSILYLGALDWRPNLDALKVLLDEVFPTVRIHESAAKLLIVGRNPPGWLKTRCAQEEAVELHADVPDVRPYLAKSLVMAVPLRIGGGSRLKILESLAAGLPVVSTRVGAEGLAIRPGVDFTLADTPGEQVTGLLECLRQPEQALAQAEQGRKTVTGRYDWTSLAARLERVWEKAVEG